MGNYSTQVFSATSTSFSPDTVCCNTLCCTLCSLVVAAVIGGDHFKTINKLERIQSINIQYAFKEGMGCTV